MSLGAGVSPTERMDPETNCVISSDKVGRAGLSDG